MVAARFSILAASLACSLVLVGASAGGNEGPRTSSEGHVATARALIQSAIDQETRAAAQLAGAGSDLAAKELAAAIDDLSHAAAEVRVAFAAEQATEHQEIQAEADLKHATESDYAATRALDAHKNRAAIEDLHGAESDKNKALAALPALPAPTSTPPKPTGPIIYPYDVTIEVSATGENFVDGYGVPGTHPTYSGGMSASITIMFPVDFTVDKKARTVAVNSASSTGGSGTDSFTITATDQGQPSDTCTVPAHTAFKAVGGLAPVWGGLPDAKSYAAGVMLFSLSAGPDKSKLYPCSASSPSSIINVTVESGLTVPGTNLQYVKIPPSQNAAAPNPGCVSGNPTDIYVPIPLSDLGKEEVTTSFRPGPVACQGTVLGALYTAHVVYTITLKRLGSG